MRCEDYDAEDFIDLINQIYLRKKEKDYLVRLNKGRIEQDVFPLEERLIHYQTCDSCMTATDEIISVLGDKNRAQVRDGIKILDDFLTKRGAAIIEGINVEN